MSRKIFVTTSPKTLKLSETALSTGGVITAPAPLERMKLLILSLSTALRAAGAGQGWGWSR